MMRIEALADRSIDQLSGGQRQRVALARALAVQPARPAAGRAADRARRQAARIAAPRDRSAAAPPRHHRDLRHPRPGRGDGARRPHRGDGARPRRAGRPAARHLPAAGDPLRRRVHRHHEPPQRQRARRRLRHRGPAAFPGPRRRQARPKCCSGRRTWLGGERERHQLTGTVAAAFFLGDRTRLFVQVGEGKPLVVETGARRDFSTAKPSASMSIRAGLMAIDETPNAGAC